LGPHAPILTLCDMRDRTRFTCGGRHKGSDLKLNVCPFILFKIGIAAVSEASSLCYKLSIDDPHRALETKTNDIFQ
jgi:hypothetical protein